MKPLTLADVGELELLERLQPYLDSALVGDDAAVLPVMGTAAAPVITTDVLVDGVHFSDRTTAPADVGWRAIAVNLSDLAAMGAMPIGVTVGLSLPPTTPLSWVEAVYQGMSQCLKAFGGSILGGDVCRAPHRSLAITALGQVAPQRTIRRDRAQPGQVIVATGYHGASRAGLELLLHPEPAPSLTAAAQTRLIKAHQRPVPRLDVVNSLAQLPDDEFQYLAGMDSSDGLANAVLHLCQASGVGARLVRSHLPIPPTLTPWVGEATAANWCLYGGEDFELVLCMSAQLAAERLPQLGSDAVILGSIEAGSTILLVDKPHANSGQSLTWDNCFKHF